MIECSTLPSPPQYKTMRKQRNKMAGKNRYNPNQNQNQTHNFKTIFLILMCFLPKAVLFTKQFKK